MITFKMKPDRNAEDWLGIIPLFLSEDDPRPAREQLHSNYQHGGGWNLFPGFKMLEDGDMKYPGDPPTKLVGEGKLRDEVIRVYESGWVAIIQPDGSFEVSQMD